MATRAPSLHDIFVSRPLQTQSDIAYANVLDTRDPVVARQARVIGREVNQPGPTVEADVDGFKQEAENNRNLSLFGNDPMLTSFYADPHNAAAAKDDIPALSSISSIFKIADGSGNNSFTNYMKRTPSLLGALGMSAPTQRYRIENPITATVPDALRPRKGLPPPPPAPPTPEPVTLPEWMGGIASSFSGNIGQAVLGTETALADTIGKGDELRGTRFFKWEQENVQKDVDEAQRISDRLPSFLSKQLYGASQSIALMGAAILSRSPIALLGIQQGTQEYEQVRERGGTANEALTAGTVSGVAESAFEKYFGLGWMLGNFGKKASGKFIGGLLMREVPSEVATTAVQDLADAMVTGGSGWDQYLKAHTELSEDNPLIQTAVQTALMVGAAGGPHFLAHKLSPEMRKMQDVQQAGAGGEFLDSLMAAAEQSKARKEDPETLKDFIDHRTQDSPVRNLYVPVEAAVQYMQSDGYGGELDRFKDQIAQAQPTQGDVVIPIGDAVAHLAGTPAWEALKEDARIEPGGLSRKEARTQGEEIFNQLEARGKEIAAEAQSTGDQRDATTEVYAEVKNRLRIAGVDDKQADAVAQIYAARYEARAARRGGTPMEQFKASGIAFPGEKVGQFGGREVAQSSPEFQKWFGESKVVDEKGAPLKVFRGLADEHLEGINHLQFWTSDPAVASHYASPSIEHMQELRESPNVVPAHLAIRNPYMLVDDKAARQLGKWIGHPWNYEPYYEQIYDPGVREKLIEKGYDGIFLPDSNGRDNHDTWVSFHATQVKSTHNAGTYDPNDPSILKQGERGSVNISDEAKVISLFATADRSTLIHETGHIWLEEMKSDALAADATDADKADWETVKKWFAANGAKVGKNNFIPTEAHELWARGIERYFMEGKSPSVALQSVFKTFKAWLLKIYGVVQNLNSPISPEVRDVMDRLIATQTAIDEARASNATEPLFKSAEDAGMTDAEFADYQKRIADARDEAYDALLFKTMEKIRRDRTAEIKDQRATVKADVTAKINAEPQFRLIHLLRTGHWLGDPNRAPENVKLNSGWLMDNYGEDIIKQLPHGHITKGDGLDGDTIAEMIGMASGSEVVHTLVGMRALSDRLKASGETRSLKNKLIADEVERIMAERHGDALTDGSIEEEAIAALNTARQGEIIAAEARQLAKRQNVLGVPTPYQFAREWARRTVAAGHVRDVASRAALQRYVRATNKAARAAEKAILDGDVDEAYRQKQAQLLNHALLAEAKAAADRVDKIIARMKKIGSRAAMKSVDPDYLDKVHALLENYDFRPRSQRAIDEQAGFQSWLEAQRAKGFEVHIPPRLENNGTPYTRVSVQELDSLNDLVESLMKLGRLKQKITVANQEREWVEVRDEMSARLRAMPDRKLTRRPLRKGFRKEMVPPINEKSRFLTGVASDFVKVEKIAEELDGGPTGPFNDLLATGARDAENKRHELRHLVLNPIADLYHKLGGKYWRRLQDRVTIPELTWNTLNEGDPRQGQPVTVTRSELLSVLMNMGNLSNLEKLSKGERWPIETLKTVMDREMTKEDYDLAQKLWDQVGQLWPHIVETERAMSGVTPEKVVEAPLQTKFGEYAGGYWPVVYDPARWQVAEDAEGKEADDMFGIKSGVATQKGHTITRTGAFGPINLSLERVLFHHVEMAITRIAYAPYARDVVRTIRDRTLRGLIDTKLGPEYRKQVEPWLQQQISGGFANAKAARWWEKTLRQFRINMQIAAMGFRHTVLLAQAEGLLGSADRIGMRWVGVGLKTYSIHPIDTVRFVLEKSAEMRYRNEAVTRETAEMSGRMRGKHTWFTTMQNFALAPIGIADRYTVSVPTWMGAYRKAMNDGMSDDDAVAFADKTVRMSQGAGTSKDLSAVQSRTGEGSRFFTMFYSPFNVMFNQQWAGVRAAKRGNPIPLLKTSFYWVVLTSMSDAMLHGDWPDWKDPEAIEAWFARNVFFGLWSGIPIVRDLANWGNQWLGGQYAGDPGVTPVGRTLSTITKAIVDAGKWYSKGDAPKAPIKEAANTTAIVTGTPISQAGTSAQFLWDVHEGNQDPQSVSDWYFGLTKGKVPKHTEEAAQ